MKAFLMHPDRDFDPERDLPVNEPLLTQDLELNTLVSAMAAGDAFLFEIARRSLLSSLRDPDAITYRQEILKDALETPSVMRDLYALAGEALAAEKSVWGSFLGGSPRTMLGTSVRKMELLVAFLRRLRDIADEHAQNFRSHGLSRFFAMLIDELGDAYLELIEGYLKELNFKGGQLLSAQLTTGNKGSGYTLRRPREQRFIERLLGRSGYSFTLPDRDEAGARALGELEDRGLNLVGNALAQSLDHVRSFLIMLRAEIGFYVACLNLNDRLASKDEPTTFPVIVPRDQVGLSAQGLYDVCLALTLDRPVVPNDIEADNKSLVMITGGQPGREVDLPARRGTCPAHESVRHVRRRHLLSGECLRRRLHALQTRGGRDDGEREVGRGAGPDERHRRPDHPALPAVVQRVVRCHQRTGRLADCPSRPRRVAGRARQGRVCHSHVRPGRQLL
jgi:hypothetical protein